MTEILFIRHGSTAGNLEKRYIGRTDEPLCDAGIQQIHALKEQALRADTLFLSPALRTRQTAEILFPHMEGTQIPDLWETDFGQFEGKTYEELSDSPAYQAWVDSGCTGKIPGGESVAEFKARCIAAFQKLTDTIPAGSTAAFVIHGGCIMAILEAYALPKKAFYDYHISNGSFIRCGWEDGVLRVL